MATVVGLVKSKLRNKSRRGKSVDGIDVLVDDGTGTLVRCKSLRQQALADPTEDDLAIACGNAPPRTPNGLDPASLAEGLQNGPTSTEVPPVPALPSKPPAEYFPARHSSLQNRGRYSIKAHHRGGSESLNDVLSVGETSEHARRRRHYTISSPNEKSHISSSAGYFPTFLEEPMSRELVNDVPGEPKTLTAKLYGSIAKKRRSIESTDGMTRSSSGGHTTNSSESSDMSRNQISGKSMTSLAHRPRASTHDASHSSPRIDSLRSAPSHTTEKHEPDIPEHVRLPPDFDLGTTERTSIETTYHPAVEQQVIHHDRTEVVQPVITRDIHVHHHFHYEQPVKVTEVLAPRHYRLDPVTGEKVEIESPPGWQLPQPFATRTPDLSDLKTTHRHYVVDEDHPDGMPESPPQSAQDGVTTWI